MTAKEALDAATATEVGERLRRYDTVCRSRGACRRELLTNDPGRWAWCPDRLTVFDSYEKTVNQISWERAIH